MEHELAGTFKVIVGLIITVSVASERLVEIIKGNFLWLNKIQSDPKEEGRRKATLQLLAALSGILTTFLSAPIFAPSLSDIYNSPTGIIIIGLLASGGSGFWNVILSYMWQAKEKKA